MGHKFGAKGAKIPLERIITSVEYVINRSRAHEHIKNEVRGKVTHHLRQITQHQKQLRGRRTEKKVWIKEEADMRRDIATTKRFLKGNPNLLVIAKRNSHNGEG